jgi:hypothetical protein
VLVHRIDASASSVIVSCDTCVMQGSAHCADCLLTHIVAPAPREEVVLDRAEQQVMRLLARAGLVPNLLHRAADCDDRG